MNCMRCGRNTDDRQFFCSSCLQEMSKYPVKPGTAVQLPVHPPAAPAPKKPPAPVKVVPPEIKIRRLKDALRILSWVLVVALLAFGITAYLLIQALEKQEQDTRPLGRNYSLTQIDDSERHI